MTIFAPSITTTAINANDAYQKVQAYRKLFNVHHHDVLTFVKGIFYDHAGDCCFLNNRSTPVTITQRSIKWFDSAVQKEIVITNDPSVDSFELTIRA